MRAWRSASAWSRIGSRINPGYRPMGNDEKSTSSSAENPSFLAGRNWFERLLVDFIAKHTPKCREVVSLLSQSMEVKLPIATRITIQFHYLICMVLPIRKTAKSVAENCLLATGARGRLLSGDFTGFIKRTDETCPPRNAAPVTAWHASEVRIKRAIRG